jgi:hypothetical protein
MPVRSDMVDLIKYLKSHSKEIVDFINEEYIPEQITTKQPFNNLATELQMVFIHEKNGVVGEKDEAHNVLAMAMICSLWCGWLTHAKANSRPEYLKTIPDLFKQVIIDAYEQGREYSKIQP